MADGGAGVPPALAAHPAGPWETTMIERVLDCLPGAHLVLNKAFDAEKSCDHLAPPAERT